MVPRRVAEVLNRPVDAASLAFFRAALGCLLVIAALRFFTHGWIEQDYRAPHYFFHYWGFTWVRPWPAAIAWLQYVIITVSAGCVALGIFYRPAALVLAATFTYAHLSDKSNYLNHYYLLSLLCWQLVCVPLDREGSLRVWRTPADRRPRIRAWVLYLLRFQIGIVYFFGGVAKLGSDWLLHAQPLRIWLLADAELPWIGPFASQRWFALLFSWCGALFDLSIVPLLAWRKTRPFAYALVVVFHLATGRLFNIGLFPWVMTAAATLFFEPDWPRRLFKRVAVAPDAAVAAPNVTFAGLVGLALYGAVQVLMPLRHFLYPGNTLWSEEGFRFAWRVMLVEKSGELEFTVVDAAGRRTIVEPREYLTPFQRRMAVTQPDMILELAHIVADDFARRGRGPVAVYADSFVAFNGRQRARLIEPTRDLARETDSLRAKDWILPAPSARPRF